MEKISVDSCLLLYRESCRFVIFVVRTFGLHRVQSFAKHMTYFATGTVLQFFINRFIQAVTRTRCVQDEYRLGSRRFFLSTSSVSLVAWVWTFFSSSFTTVFADGLLGNLCGQDILSSVKNSGPSIQDLLWHNSVVESPLVGRSAGLISPGMCRHSSGLEFRWISATLLATNGLKMAALVMYPIQNVCRVWPICCSVNVQRPWNVRGQTAG